MRVRRMQPGDLEQVEVLERICFTDSWSGTLLADGLNNSLDSFWVLEEEADGRITGYANLRVIAGEGEIQRIAVLPGERGRGLGRKLMEIMVSSARENHVREMTLEVRSGNVPAINLYKTYGFAMEGRRKAYYSNPVEDGLIMWNRNI